MARGWNRLETWLGLTALGVGGVLLAVGGLWVYVSATATPIHPNAQDVSSVAHGAPDQQWTVATDQARRIVKAALSEQNIPGYSVAVGTGSGMVWAEGFGWADLERRTPVTPDTRFRIGSASNVLTSAAVGALLDRGRLSLDDEIQRWVPEFPKQKWPVTLRHVMGHTAGIRNDGGDEGPLFGQHCERPVDALPAFASRELLFEPGTFFRFSNFGFIVVSAAVEAAAEEPFVIFMRKRVFEPLGMTHTDIDSQPPSEDQAVSYFPRFAADPRYGPDPMRPLDLSCYAGASVFVSTAADLVRFATAINGGSFLKPDTVQALQAAQRLSSGEETGYGLGWDIENLQLLGRPARAVGHDGELLGGNAASLMTFPDRGLAVVVIANTSYADTPGVALKIAQVFADAATDHGRR